MQSRFYVPSFHFNTTKPCYCGSMKAFGHCCASGSGQRVFPQSIKVVNNFMPKDECRKLVDFAEKQKKEWLKIVDIDPKTGQKIVRRHPTRVTQRVHLDNRQALVSAWMERACREHLPAHVAPPEWFETPQMLRYGVGGKYSMHSDAENYCPQANRFYRFIDRDFSMLIYLNDDYVGGGLKFKGLNFGYQPKAGDLVLFPSNHVFSHESLPIESGTKYALVSWGAFRGSPRVAAPKKIVSLH
jgi:predicted 2-oxoglutarate/Fe(II)-dependent dioxygenase YbiX